MRFVSIMAILLVISTVSSAFAAPLQNSSFSSGPVTAGRYVSFSLNSDLQGLPMYMAGPNMSGEKLIDSFSLMGTPLFSYISSSNIGNVTIKQKGSSFVLEGTGGELAIHDNPSGIIIFDAYREGSLEISVDKDLDLKVENNTVILNRQGEIGRVFLTSGALNISSNRISVSLQSGSRMIFRAFSYMNYSDDEAAIMSSILSGKVAGEFYINRDGELVRDDYSAYGAMEARTSMVSDDKIGISATGGAEGGIILVHIPDSLLKAGTVIIDGKEAATAPSLSQILHYSGGPNAYFILHEGNYTSVLIYLSGPGEHTVSIRESPNFGLSAGDYLTISIGASIVVLAALLLFRKND